MTSHADDELRLVDYLATIKRRWAWALLPLVVFSVAALLVSLNRADRFEASAQVLLTDTAAQEAIGGVSQNTNFRDRTLENEISMALGDQTSAEIAERLGLDSDDVPDFTVTAGDSSDILRFIASASTADEAAAIANSAAESYVSVKNRQAADSIAVAVTGLETTLQDLQLRRETIRADLVRLEDELAEANSEDRLLAQARVDREESRIAGSIAVIDARIEATADDIAELELRAALALAGTARIVTVATPPTTGSNSPLFRNLAFGLLIGSIVGMALASTRERLDERVRTTADLERLGLASLGSIPGLPKRAQQTTGMAALSMTDPDSPQARAHGRALTTLRFLASQHEINSVLVTSASPREGKTSQATNLAISMALTNVRTVLVDVDLRRPSVHEIFGLPQTPGLSTAVSNGQNVLGCAFPVTNVENLTVVPAGELPDHASSFVASIDFTNAIGTFSKSFEFTILDAPPVLPVPDALSLAPLVGGVVVVAYAKKTKTEELRATVEALLDSGAQILGAVLVGAVKRRSDYAEY